jgi:glycosyl transferase family 25
MDSINDIKHAVYINLLSRPDRKQHVENQLQNIGIKATRFNAVQLNNGAIGCSMSHLKIMEMAKQNNWPHVLIVEDDILFTNPTLFMTQFNKFLSTNKSFDVVLIAGNNAAPYKIIDNTCVKITGCQTTTGYLVQSHYYDTLIQNYKDGILNLIKNPANHSSFAIDKYWFQLQSSHNWFLITPLTVTQREDYSNIEHKRTNYTWLMTDLEKPFLLK